MPYFVIFSRKKDFKENMAILRGILVKIFDSMGSGIYTTF